LKKSDFIVVLPAYNEEQTLPIVVQKIETYFSCNQIILADDGSTDRTNAIGRKLGLKIIRNRHNQGKGHILRKTFSVILRKIPNAKWIMTMDADDQHYQKDIPSFIEAIELNQDVDIVLGRRNYNQMPPFNMVSNTLTTGWCNYWLSWNLYDLQCGFRC
jgi:glycosyltransferase involved in cell wall biosynthesis